MGARSGRPFRPSRGGGPGEQAHVDPRTRSRHRRSFGHGGTGDRLRGTRRLEPGALSRGPPAAHHGCAAGVGGSGRRRDPVRPRIPLEAGGERGAHPRRPRVRVGRRAGGAEVRGALGLGERGRRSRRASRARVGEQGRRRRCRSRRPPTRSTSASSWSPSRWSPPAPTRFSPRLSGPRSSSPPREPAPPPSAPPRPCGA